MRQLLYVSDAAPDLSGGELDTIVAASRRNNLLLNITGLLIYNGGGFLQLLEGEERAVRDTYVRIRAYNRHREPRQLLDRESPRVFIGWSMGFEHVKEADVETAGLYGVTREAMAGRLSPSAGTVVATMLETFYRVRRSDDLRLAETG